MNQPPFPSGSRDAQVSANSHFQQGKDAWELSSGAQVIGNGVQLTAFVNELQWAIYRFGIGETEMPTVLDLQVSESDTDEIWLALANYSTGRWEFRGPLTAAEANAPILLSEAPFDLGDLNYIAPSNNIYIGVMAAADHGCLVQNLNLTLGYRYSPPIAQLTAAEPEGIEGRTTNVYCNLSDADNDIAAFQWDLDGDGNFETFTGTQSSTVATFPANGTTLDIAVRVTDRTNLSDEASCTLTGTVVEGAQLPVADASAAAFAIVAGNPAFAFRYGYSVYFVRALDQAGTQWPAPLLIDTTTNVNTSKLDLAIIGGMPAILESNPWGTFYYRSTDLLGTDWAFPASVADSCGDSPQLAEVNGMPAACWYNPGGDFGIPCYIWYSHAFDATGMVWSTPVSPDSGPYYGPASLADVNGRPAVAYEIGPQGIVAPVDPGHVVFLRASDSDGQIWPEPLELVEDGSSPTLKVLNGKPSICCGGPGGTTFLAANDLDGLDWGLPVTLLAGSPAASELGLVGGKPAAAFINSRGLYFAAALDSGGAAWNTPAKLDMDQNYSFTSLGIGETSAGPCVGYLFRGSKAIFCSGF